MPSARPETFRSKLPAIAAATLGTVLAALLGSYLGTGGTLAGLAVGTAAAGSVSWWAERGIRRSAAVAAAKAQAVRARGRDLTPAEETMVITAATRQHDRRERRRRRWPAPPRSPSPRSPPRRCP